MIDLDIKFKVGDRVKSGPALIGKEATWENYTVKKVDDRVWCSPESATWGFAYLPDEIELMEK